MADELTGIELRRAAAKCVGWKWYKVFAWDGLQRNLENAQPTWDDAMAVAEAAGMEFHISWDFRGQYDVGVLLKDYFETRTGPNGPETLLRAVVAACRAQEESGGT